MGTSGKGWFSHQTWSRLYQRFALRAVNIFINGVSDWLCLLLGCSSSLRPTSLVHQEFEKADITASFLQESLLGFRTVIQLFPILDKKTQTTTITTTTTKQPRAKSNQPTKTQNKTKKQPQNTKTNQPIPPKPHQCVCIGNWGGKNC